MSDQINLLSVDRKIEKKRSSAFSYSLLFLLLCVLVSVVLIFILFLFKMRLSTLSHDQSQIVSQIKADDSKRILYLTAKERLLSIEKIMKGNSTLLSRVNLVVKNIPQGINVDDMQVDSGKITVTVSSSSLSSLNTFLSIGLTAISQQKGVQVRIINVDGFEINKSKSGYNSKVTFLFPVSDSRSN